MGSYCCGVGDDVDQLVEEQEAKRDTIKRTKSGNPYRTGMADEKQMAQEQKEIFNLDPDDYVNQITVYVIQGRDLPKYDIGINAKSDPYVKVRIGNSKPLKTQAIRRDLNPVWNDQFVEKGIGLFRKVKQISFEVFDHDKITRDDLMGTCILPTVTELKQHYTTPVEWINLRDEKGEFVKGKSGKISAIQIQVRYTMNSDDVNIRYFTHVCELKIKRAKNLHSKEMIGKSDPYVKVEWGAQLFHTRYVNGTDNPTWNESAFLFVHEEYQSKFQLKFSVMDRDIGPDDHLGTGYVAAGAILDGCKKSNKLTFGLDIKLRVVPVNLDRGLHDFDKDKKFKPWGDLEVEAKLIPKKEIEANFYASLVQTFDKNHDGVIDRDEVNNMFATLAIPETSKLSEEELFNKFDENNDEKLDEREVIKMLQDSNFQGSALATQLIDIFLKGELSNDSQKHLMSGFSHKHLSSSKVVLIKDRETGLLVQEFVPGYVWYSLKLVYDIKLNRAVIQSKVANKLLHEMSKNRGKKMDSPKSASEIKGFIKQHNLDTNMLHKEVKEFRTFNDFFARGIKADEFRPLHNPKDELVVVSPADCRLMVFDSILDTTKFWIKGSKFTLENLVGKKSKVNIKRYNGGSFVIARLAPQDYHRWHYPLSGQVVNIEKIKGALYTVNPIAINKSVNVYTENKRAIVEIDTGDKAVGRYIMFVIAATMVGSYNLFSSEHKDPKKHGPIRLKEGDKIRRGDVAGEFRFGGSTILLLFEPNKVKFDEDIVRNVNAKFETLATVRSRIGRIKVKENKPQQQNDDNN